MRLYKNKIDDDCYEVRVCFGRGPGSEKRRRFKSNKDAEEFKNRLIKLEALDLALADRFLNDEDYFSLLKEYRDPEEKRTLAAQTTMQAEVEHWLKYQASEHSPGWISNVEGYWQELSGIIGSVPVSKISKSTLDDLDAYFKKKGNSRNTINKKLGWIQAVLNFSVDRERIESNPVVRYKKKKAPKVDIPFWEKDDALSFLQSMNEKYPPGSKNRKRFVIYLTALNTGVRAGELWALRPSSLRKSFGVIRVHEQFHLVAKDFRELKGKKARNVPLNPALEQELNDFIASNKIGRNELLFTSDKGTPMDHNNFLRVFEADLATWEGPEIVFHGLRHTAGTLMLASGVAINTVQMILGHEDIATTMKYMHLLSGAVKEASTKYSLTLNLESNEPPPAPKNVSEKGGKHLHLVG